MLCSDVDVGQIWETRYPDGHILTVEVMMIEDDDHAFGAFDCQCGHSWQEEMTLGWLTSTAKLVS